MDDEIVRQLKAAVRGEVRFDPLTRQLYSTDASHYRVVPHGVVLPRDADDIAAVVAGCAAAAELAASMAVLDATPFDAAKVTALIDASAKLDDAAKTSLKADVTAAGTDALFVEFPLARFAADKLQSARSIGQRPFVGRHHSSQMRLPGVAVVDGDDGDAGLDTGFEFTRIGLVTRHPTASMDEEQQRGGLGRFGFVKIQHLTLMRAISNIRHSGRTPRFSGGFGRCCLSGDRKDAQKRNEGGDDGTHGRGKTCSAQGFFLAAFLFPAFFTTSGQFGSPTRMAFINDSAFATSSGFSAARSFDSLTSAFRS